MLRRTITAALATLISLIAFAAERAQAVFEPVWEDGFECREWFTDADIDGFGATGTGTLSCVSIPGRVPRDGDCNDASAAVNPLAIDRPDAGYVDANCDGFDGDADRAIHVATTGTDVAGCGLRSAPCATVPFAVSQRTPTRADIYVRQGVYLGAVTVPALPGAANPGIFGGFNGSWQRAPGVIVRIEGQTMATLDGGTGGIFIDNSTLELGDLEVEAPNASGQSSGYGRASVGIVARGSNVLIWGLRVRAGLGSAGLAGAAAPPFPGAAPPGFSGASAILRPSCSTASGGSGAATATNNACGVGSSNPTSGAGGNGGAADTACSFPPNSTAQPGNAGLGAAVTSGMAGAGGFGGNGSSTCGPGSNGQAGVIGGSGSGGNAVPSGAVVAGNWRSNKGGNGSLGTSGGGGGGGGGSGGCDNGDNAAGAGGGSGGAGGCAATTGGEGGFGGGASIAVFLSGSSADITGSTLETAGGGSGGAGGAGGAGQAGGNAGPGGAAVANTGVGGAGGAGGRGGASGGGAGGTGGPAFGILRSAGALTQSGNTFLLGAGGAGGSAGAPAMFGNPGGVGVSGVSMQVLQL